MSLQQVDCWFLSQNDGTTNSELGYPTMYHWKQQPKPNPSVIRHTNNVESVVFDSGRPTWQSKGRTRHVSSRKGCIRCQAHTILVEDVATKEYHSKNQANKLTLVLSTNGGVVLINEDPNSTSLQADCCVSQKLCCTNSELTYPAIYHWKQQPKPNPSVIRHTDSVE